MKARLNRIDDSLCRYRDGAIELREGAKTLEKPKQNILVLHDFKHYAASVLKKVVGKDE